MIKLENVQVWGWEHTIRGCRNPLNSWDKSDSLWETYENGEAHFIVGKADIDLMNRLYNASLSGDNHAHRKFLRQISVSMDIVAPLYWWKQFDTYKIGVTTNSCSTMHKIAAKEFVLDDFSHEMMFMPSLEVLQTVINELNRWRELYINGGSSKMGKLEDVTMRFDPKDKYVWWQMIQLLPSSYNQRRTVTMNYEVALAMINQRAGHKLQEWHDFVDVLKDLPLMKEITAPRN